MRLYNYLVKKSHGRYERFLKAGEEADEAMQQSGLAYDARAVHQYLLAKVRGRPARRPKPVRWRR